MFITALFITVKNWKNPHVLSLFLKKLFIWLWWVLVAALGIFSLC